MKIKKNTGFSDIFLLKSPRPVIPNLGTHRTELRQVRAVRADFEVFEWNLTVLLTVPVHTDVSAHREGYIIDRDRRDAGAAGLPGLLFFLATVKHVKLASTT